jgi:hypothetical protein
MIAAIDRRGLVTQHQPMPINPVGYQQRQLLAAVLVQERKNIIRPD